MRNRILSMVLAVAMTMSLLVVGAGTAFADGHDYENPYPLQSSTTVTSDGDYSYVTYMEYTYDDSGNLLTETSWGDESDYREQFAYTYDSDGNILSETRSYSENGVDYVLWYQDSWTYDSYGNPLTEYGIVYYDSFDGAFPDVCDIYQSSCTYTYNDDGTIATAYWVYIEEDYEFGETYEGSYQVSYAYDSHGNVLTYAYSDSDGFTEIFTYTYTYGESGNILSQTRMDDYGNTWVCTYDENGNLLTDTTSYIDWDTYTYTYTYDGYGNVLSTTYSSSEETGYTGTYTYTYDESGNVLTENYSSSNGDSHAYTYNGNGKLLVAIDCWTDGSYITATTTYNYIGIFSDIYTSNYFYDSVTWAVDNEITSGTTATTFSPYNEAERCQVVTFLWRAAGCPEVEEGTENPFTDVDEDDYFYTAVLWAVQEGITSGTSETTFSPYAKCERCQVVTFLYRYAGEPEVTAASNPFTDVDTADYFYNAVLWAVEEGITTGTSDTTFGPFVTCERCMVVTFLYRALAA